MGRIRIRHERAAGAALRPVLLFLAGALAAVHADPARAEGEGIYGRLEVKDNEEHLLKTAAATEDLFVRRGYRYDDRALGQAVTRIGARLAPRPSDPYIRYRFHVLRDIEPNAFALPDGQVYVNTGLLAILENEAQLAALLAHEVHHAAGHHGILSYRSARRKIIGSMVLGPLTLGVGDYFLVRSIFGYSRDLEEEADRLGAKRMVQAGYDPRQMADMLALLAGDPEGEQPKTRASKWSTHPELHARVATVRGLIPGLMVGRKPAALEVGAAGFRRLTRRAALDTAHDLVAADYPRTALALCSRLLNEKPDDPAAHYAAAEALRTLGARPALAGEQTLTDKEKRRNLRQRAYLTRDERQDRLIETEEGRQALSANMGAAVKSYRRALALDPSLAEAHRGLGFALEALGRPREAGQELVTYLRARPDAPDKPLVADRLRAITTTLKEGGSTR